MTSQPAGPLPDRSSLQTSAIILIVVGLLCGGMIPAIFGIIALVQMDSDPTTAQKMNKVGWIIFWVMLALMVLIAVGALLVNLLVIGVVSLPVIMGG
ncbi:hypothetical protein CFK38_11850 [Brachybacterium vulturis]|uniref:DUF4190 domain-containing protein n=1 Tax=Brachybacterium vulturis TaxID=2017484 RepID=A0A291GPL3_9MICO|nr:hypothetical protein [Brachybacterium vulturis]ATG52138.1 hypothetical protein CFK38_11850 [Brachybacterium vulturis]